MFSASFCICQKKASEKASFAGTILRDIVFKIRNDQSLD